MKTGLYAYETIATGMSLSKGDMLYYLGEELLGQLILWR